jgi:hypothetical protein
MRFSGFMLMLRTLIVNAPFGELNARKWGNL